ncbi:ABC transporter permease [Xanthovirga aplysinae]|uniref:ABC transporter permease n=1 Tax=Xanthovirga aplysinae TaxID=2529853 RepID=UPI0012BD6535|nr:ABC transporter permease [Xanthovirga aplysinae]MTI33167.1 ABC transporter permease [Xanthovirga aplysinae]
MLENYIKIAFRNILKHKFYTFINITGLAIGMACCFLIFLWVKDELNYDRYNTKYDRIYRITTKLKLNGDKEHMAITPAPLATTLKNELPGVEETARLTAWTDYYNITYGKTTFSEIKGIFADSTLFNIFTIPFEKGNPYHALTQPHSVIIDVSTAKKIFGKEDPIGKTVTIERRGDFIINGIMKDMPENSHFRANVFLSLNSVKWSEWNNWVGENNFYTYALLREGTNPITVENKFKELVEKYVGPQVSNVIGSPESIAEFDDNFSFNLQPLKNIHLRSKVKYDTSTHGNINYVYLLSTIAFIILLIACINYMNLATARSVERSKEVGLRKTLGAHRPQMVVQFLCESILLTLIALFLALIILDSMLPIFNFWSGKSIFIDYGTNIPLLIFISIIVLVVGLLSGGYPAIYLSGTGPIQALKGLQTKGGKGGNLRNLLVTLQFAASIFFIIGTATVYKQLFYLRNTDTGYNKEGLLVLHNSYYLDKKIESFKKEVLRQPLFKSATITSYSPVSSISNNNNSIFWPEGPQTEENSHFMYRWWVDNDFQKTMEMEMVNGRFFSSELPSDSSTVVINEAAAKLLGYEDPIGRKINSKTPEGDISNTIIGVIQDFNYKTLKNKIEPLILYLGRDQYLITFRIDSQHTQEAIQLLQEKWQQMVPGKEFIYSFLDADFANEYEREEKMGQIFTFFSVLAISIACLGLFGLAAFTAEQRKKEIGVRKVLGATVGEIILLLSKSFGRLLIIAFVLACPLGWWVMNKWLENFQYRTSIGVEVFILAGILSFFVAWIAMSYHAFKAAKDDPVNSIRYE